jgi:Asp/Glu/hydantoin racemase
MCSTGSICRPDRGDAVPPPPRIVLIHATPVAIAPVRAAFAKDWPEAEVVNLLEDSLSGDRAAAGTLTAEMSGRIRALADYAASIGAAGILFTCSAFGEAIEAARAGAAIPILKPNEAMFDRALRSGTRIGMLATFAPSVEGMEAEFRAAADAQGSAASIETVLVEAAMAALRGGDEATHNRLLGEAATRLAGCDAVMLAHFSTARARGEVEDRLACPVLTSPGAAVAALKARLLRTG